MIYRLLLLTFLARVAFASEAAPLLDSSVANTQGAAIVRQNAVDESEDLLDSNGESLASCINKAFLAQRVKENIEDYTVQENTMVKNGESPKELGFTEVPEVTFATIMEGVISGSRRVRNAILPSERFTKTALHVVLVRAANFFRSVYSDVKEDVLALHPMRGASVGFLNESDGQPFPWRAVAVPSQSLIGSNTQAGLGTEYRLDVGDVKELLLVDDTIDSGYTASIHLSNIGHILKERGLPFPKVRVAVAIMKNGRKESPRLTFNGKTYKLPKAQEFRGSVKKRLMLQLTYREINKHLASDKQFMCSISDKADLEARSVIDQAVSKEFSLIASKVKEQYGSALSGPHFYDYSTQGLANSGILPQEQANDLWICFHQTSVSLEPGLNFVPALDSLQATQQIPNFIAPMCVHIGDKSMRVYDRPAFYSNVAEEYKGTASFLDSPMAVLQSDGDGNLVATENFLEFLKARSELSPDKKLGVLLPCKSFENLSIPNFDDKEMCQYVQSLKRVSEHSF